MNKLEDQVFDILTENENLKTKLDENKEKIEELKELKK